MQLKVLGSNQIELKFQGREHVRILFSYNTPVAAEIDGEVCRTMEKHSKTTSKHINHWLDGESCPLRPQEYFDWLVNRIVLEEETL